MKTALIRSFGAYFPRKSGATHCYASTLHGKGVDKGEDERDVRFITEEEKKNHLKSVKNMKRRPETNPDFHVNVGDKKSKTNLGKARDTSLARKPISFANL